MTLQVGSQAPDFKGVSVLNGDFNDITSADYRGKWVVLFFYPLDFTFVCPTEITAFSDRYEEFKALGAEVIGVSVDSQFSHLAWTQQERNQGGLGNINYPLLADITKTVSRDYGVLLEDAGVSLRGLFILNPEGGLEYQVVHNLGFGRSVDETLRVLEAIQFTRENGEVCPAGWTKGAKTIKPAPTDSQEYFNSLD